MGPLSPVLLAFAACFSTASAISGASADPATIATAPALAAPIASSGDKPSATPPRDARGDDKRSGFRALDFEGARSAARVERRPMLVLFCDGEEGCRALAAGLGSEVKLRTWLDEKVVAIQLDRGAVPELVAKYRVRATPTWLFFDAKGIEIDRIVGTRDSKTLRAEGEDVLKGGDPLERLQTLRVGRESDPDLRLRYADILGDRGDLDTAIAEYLAIVDVGGAAGAAAFEELLRLARAYPKAAEAVASRASAIEPRILSAQATDEEFESWFGLCRQMRLETRMLTVHDALAGIAADPEVDHARAERVAVLRARIAPELRDLFYTDRRYADIAALIVDAQKDFAARKLRHAEVVARGNASETKSSLARLRDDTARDYETLLGVRRLGEAILLADALINFDPTVATYDELIEKAQRAESKGDAKMLAERGRADARIEERARYRIGPSVPHKR